MDLSKTYFRYAFQVLILQVSEIQTCQRNMNKITSFTSQNGYTSSQNKNSEIWWACAANYSIRVYRIIKGASQTQPAMRIQRTWMGTQQLNKILIHLSVVIGNKDFQVIAQLHGEATALFVCVRKTSVKSQED